MCSLARPQPKVSPPRTQLELLVLGLERSVDGRALAKRLRIVSRSTPTPKGGGVGRSDAPRAVAKRRRERLAADLQSRSIARRPKAASRLGFVMSSRLFSVRANRFRSVGAKQGTGSGGHAAVRAGACA